MPDKLSGIFAATVTPLNTDRTVDHALLAQHCHFLLEEGGDGIALLGTTGEASSFSWRERKTILERLIGSGFDPRRLIVGTGCCSLDETVYLTRHACEIGAGGVLIMPPFYYRSVNSEGLYQYFSALIEKADNSDIRIYLYHFPRMSGIDMSISLVTRLVTSFGPLIAGMKDSGGDPGHMRSVMEAIPGFGLFSGNEVFLPQLLNMGGVGCITATANLYIHLIRKVYDQWHEGSVDRDALQAMTDHRNSYAGTVYASSLKGVLANLNERASWNRVRAPLTPTDEEVVGRIAAGVVRFAKS